MRTFFTSALTRGKTIPKNLKGKGKSSQEWLTRQLNDPYVAKAREMNFRARSAFKLLEMDEKLKILKPGLIAVECGAAPGAWTQVLVRKLNSDGRDPQEPTGKVVGIDLLPIEPLPGAFLLPSCDFTSHETQAKVLRLLELPEGAMSRGLDLVLSDMAPNATGNGDTDHPRIMGLVRQALAFAAQNGREGSHFLAKVWDGGEVRALETELERLYYKVGRLKPPCSRSDSSELFLYGKKMRKQKID